MKILTIPVLMAGTLWLVGCADGNHRPYVLDDSFGKSANHLVKAQIANPQAAAHPQADSPKKMDGYAGVNIIRTYRNTYGQDTQPQPLTINIGGASGSSSGGQ